MPAPARPAPTTTRGRAAGCGRRLRGPRALCPGGGDRHVPFAAIAGFTARVETGFGQCPTQLAGAGPGGQGRAGRCHGGQFAQQRRFPHARVTPRRKTIQEVRIHAGVQTRRHGLRLAKGQVSVTAPPSPEPVQAGSGSGHWAASSRARPASGLARGAPTAQPDPPERRDGLRPPARAARAARRVVAPCPPQRQKIQAQPEPGLADREGIPAAPAFRQAIAPQESAWPSAPAGEW